MSSKQPPNAPSKSSPDIKSLLRGTVSASERHIIQQRILDAETELRNYQAEISGLKAKIVILETKAGGVGKRMKKYRSLLSPVYRMPQEMLVEIFACCCEGDELVPSRAPTAMILAEASISVRFDTWMDAKGGAEQLRSFLGSFIDRSNNKGISVSLRSSKVAQQDQEQLDALIGALRGLLDCSTRWHQFTCSHTLLQLPALQNLRSRLPALQGLHVISRIEDNSDSLFVDCPSLTALSISPDGWVPGDLPLRHVKSLSLLNAHAPAALDILRSPSCTNVQELDLHRIGGHLTLPETDHVLLSSLRHLTITAQNEEDVTSIFYTSTFQSLSILSVHRDKLGSSEWCRLDLAPMKGFFLRSACEIISLRLDSLPLTDADTISLLHLMPTLKSLTIGEYEQNGQNKIVTPAFLELFSVMDVDESSSFLPLLSDLDLVVHFPSLHIQSLIAAIASRAPGNYSTTSSSAACLKSVTLTVMAKERPDMELFSVLRCFKDVGVRIDISHKET